MKLARALATVYTMAAAAVALSAGGATADDELLSALNNPAIGAACLPSGQVGVGNTVNGTQNVSCSQSASQTIPTPPANGGVTGAERVMGSANANANSAFFVDVPCPSGKIATGGGYLGSINASITVTGSAPVGDPPTSWRVYGINYGGFATVVDAYAVCVDSAE
ncbi:hypothetical protein ABT075_37850 [Streptomyces sp. NPDC002677]|uniref:hypothetical protein n=1 Tax=Streptomyces sp. NPDC002677 TaxID=3154774 RepID=UPI003330A8E5